MLRRSTLTRAFLVAATLAGACELPLLANGVNGAIVIQALPRHGTTERRPEEQPSPARVSLEGRVEDSYKSLTKVAGATLEFVKGPNTGRVTVTDARGFFSFSDLEPSLGGQVLRISHPSYRTGNFTPSVWKHRPVNQFNPRLLPLALPPPALTVTDSFRGSVSSFQAACNMPDEDYPCATFRLSSASGKPSLSAELTWTATADVDLDVILYANGMPIARSVSRGPKKDVLNASTNGSGPFDMRVIILSRRGTASFTLAVKRTN
jgi:hypothetical protein